MVRPLKKEEVETEILSVSMELILQEIVTLLSSNMEEGEVEVWMQRIFF